MAKKLAELIVEVLSGAAVRGRRRLAQRLYRCNTLTEGAAMDSRAARRSSSVCRGRRGAPDRATNSLRGELWTGQPATDQRSLRLPSKPGTGARDCCTNSQQ